jgi:hypothetical protein
MRKSWAHPFTLAVIGTSLAFGSISFAQEEAKPADPGQAPAKPAMTPEQMQMKVWQTVSGSGAAIDRCTDAYLKEYPTASGNVQLKATVVKDGTVGQASADTSLDGARNLRPCIEKVAKGWKLPPLQTESEQLSLTVVVKKGTKFSLRKPGEKDEQKPAAGGGQQDEGFMDFLPRSWSESPK